MCSRFREIDLFVVKTKHGIVAAQKLDGFVHDHLRKEQTVLDENCQWKFKC